MTNHKNSRKGLKICCCASAVALITIVVVSVTMFLTVLKPKQPLVTAHPASFDSIEFQISPAPSLNATLGLVISIDNPNYGSFKYKNTTADVTYHGSSVAEVIIEHDTVPARGKLKITASANLTADKVASSPYFWDDVHKGCLNLISTATLHGKVIVFKIFKMDGTASSTCDISIFIYSHNIESKCMSKFKF